MLTSTTHGDENDIDDDYYVCSADDDVSAYTAVAAAAAVVVAAAAAAVADDDDDGDYRLRNIVTVVNCTLLHDTLLFYVNGQSIHVHMSTRHLLY